MSKLPIFKLCLSVGNLKPKLEWFLKPKNKPRTATGPDTMYSNPKF